MINIAKGDDPQPLIDFKAETQKEKAGSPCNYDMLRRPFMNLYKRALLQEQHYLCAYCNRRLDEYASNENDDKLHHLKIEHWYPQSLCKEEAEYNTVNGRDVAHGNILIVCPGRNVNPNFQHCDSSRTPRATLTIKPHHATYSFENVFSYQGGALITSDADIHNDINNQLNLNEAMLVYRRNIVLDTFSKQLRAQGGYDKNELIRKYSTPNGDGKKREYCTIILFFLNSL